ncbi:hypothetical protein MTO96_009680 [Rhipicephalus appendiculatus]
MLPRDAPAPRDDVDAIRLTLYAMVALRDTQQHIGGVASRPGIGPNDSDAGQAGRRGALLVTACSVEIILHVEAGVTTCYGASDTASPLYVYPRTQLWLYWPPKMGGDAALQSKKEVFTPVQLCPAASS